MKKKPATAPRATRAKTSAPAPPSATRFEAFEEKHPSLHYLLHKAEWFVDKATIPILILLAIVIVLEFTVNLGDYEHYVMLFDYFIIAFFIVDLLFKYGHTKTVLRFVRLYWLEILAVLPFYYLFRFFSGFAALGETVGEAQKLTHEALLTRESELLAREAQVLRETRMIREAEVIGREAELGSRIVRFFQNTYRLIAARLHLATQAVSDQTITHGGTPPTKRPLHVWALGFLVVWCFAGLLLIVYELSLFGWQGIVDLVWGQGSAAAVVLIAVVVCYALIAFAVGRMVWRRKTAA
jgi:hypothetical protein